MSSTLKDAALRQECSAAPAKAKANLFFLFTFDTPRQGPNSRISTNGGGADGVEPNKGKTSKMKSSGKQQLKSNKMKTNIFSKTSAARIASYHTRGTHTAPTKRRLTQITPGPTFVHLVNPDHKGTV
jgi:hypothetical protein